MERGHQQAPFGDGPYWSPDALARLCSFPGIGPRRAIALAGAYADWSELHRAGPEALRSVAGRPAEQLSGAPEPSTVLDRGTGALVGWFDPEFPFAFRGIPDPPAFVWVKGRIPPVPAAAVVGTRTPTDLGRRTAAAITERVVAAGLCVVSGLALGVDTVAHATCLGIGGMTVAVLGSGIDDPSPASNAALADRIVSHGGALVSEVPPDTPASARSLVARDRLQSALSQVVVVVECGVSSGTLHTARFAIAQGRTLACALPPPALRREPEMAGNWLLTDPTGIDPRVLGATGPLSRVISERRPAADLVVTRPSDLDALLAGLS